MRTGGGACGGAAGTSAKLCDPPNARATTGPTAGGGAAGVVRATDRSVDASAGFARMTLSADRTVDDIGAGGGAAGAELVHPKRGSGPPVGAGVGAGAGAGGGVAVGVPTDTRPVNV